MAARTGLWPDLGTAVGAYAIAPSGERGSFADRLPLPMRLIDRYICRQVFSHALLGLGIFSFVFFVPQLVRLMDLVVRHSSSWSTLGILFLCTLPGILSFTLPMGVLVGVLIALGRMSADSELIAMSALGLGRRRLLVPIGILAAGVRRALPTLRPLCKRY